MPLPTEFQFSQASLQDFVTCARRFKLRYLDELRWPAVETEPVAEAERLARLGTDFHRVVHQHLVGLDVDTLTATLALAEPDLKSWWHNYLAYRPPELTGARLYPELSLSTPLQGYRLLARFDVLAVMICYGLTLALLTLAGFMHGLGYWYYAGLLTAAGFAIYHYQLIKGRAREGCFAAFRNNNWLGAAVMAGVLLDFAVG